MEFGFRHSGVILGARSCRQLSFFIFLALFCTQKVKCAVGAQTSEITTRYYNFTVW
jgi:hypothetical protein